MRRPSPIRAADTRSAIRTWVAVAGAAAAAPALGGCCAWPFEDATSGYSDSRVVAMPAKVAQAGYRLDQPLDPAVCKDVCSRDECFPSSLVIEPGLESAVIVCNDYSPRACADAGLFRMPSGRRAALVGGELSATFSALASAEAASAEDFDELADDLHAHRAPNELLERLRRASRDERRHDAAMRGLAARFGRCNAGVTRKRTRRARLTLPALAVENVVLGCVGETWGAFLLALGARRASDPAVRRAFARIADDEADHAALAFSIHSWLWARIDDDARASVARALDVALVDLARAAPVAGRELRLALGSPTDVDYEAVVPRVVAFVRAGTRRLDLSLS